MHKGYQWLAYQRGLCNVRDTEKMNRCTVQFHNSLHKAISNKRIG